MKIKFKTIILHNFLSFEDAKLELDNKGFVAVQGINNNPDDSALSNGSGKSSLFEAISWCICGETVRGTKEVTRLGESDCSVELHFDVDATSYKLIRTKDPSTLKIYINGEDKSGKGIRDSEKLLSEYLPDLTGSLLGSVVILGQGLPQRLSNNTPSGRKEVLEKLSKSDFMLFDIKDRIAARKTVLSNDLRKAEDTNLTLTTQRASATSLISTLNAKLESLVKPSEEAVAFAKSQAEAAEMAYTAALTTSTTLSESISALEVELANQNTKKERTLAENAQSVQDKLKSLEATKAELNARIESLNKELSRIAAITDTCPMCGQKLNNVEIPSTDPINAELTGLRNSLTVVLDTIYDTNTELAAKKNKVNIEFEKTVEELRVKLDTLRTEKTKLNLDLLYANYNNLNAQHTSLASALATYTAMVSNLTEQKKAAETSLVDLDQKILYNNNVTDSINSKIDIVNRISNLITRDFRGYLLTNVIDYINKKAKEYSLDIFETDKIEFSLNGNNIDIMYDGKEYPNLSGGEKQKVDVIIQFALRDMLCNYSNFSSNILVLDEISDNIDAVGAEKLFNMIANKLTDVESIFIISHHHDFDIPIDNEVTVVKGIDKISRIR